MTTAPRSPAVLDWFRALLHVGTSLDEAIEHRRLDALLRTSEEARRRALVLLRRREDEREARLRRLDLQARLADHREGR